MSISNRIFGADIIGKVKDKLKLRQRLAGDSTESKSTLTNYNIDHDGAPDLSSRTPFARMWTAVDIIDVIKRQEATTDEEMAAAKESIIYQIGNHHLNSLPGENSVALQDGEVAKREQESGGGNEFMKPPAGITSVVSSTEKKLGAIRTTTVSFIVHEINDFQNIYQKFFLRPGAQIFVDFGWSTLSPSDTDGDPKTPGVELYDPKELMTTYDGKLDEFLYGEKESIRQEKGQNLNGFVTRNVGDVDTFFGLVKNYTAKMNAQGGYECTVELTSYNSALFGFARDRDATKMAHRVQNKIDRDVMLIGIASLIPPEERKFLEKQIDDANFTSDQTTEVLDLFSSFLQQKATVRGDGVTPNDIAVQTGVFPGGFQNNTDESYISLGFFEDYILNPEFGHAGRNIKEREQALTDILEGKDNAQIRFDSSNSWTHWSYLDILKQQALDGMAETPGVFLFPANWDKSYSSSYVKEEDDLDDIGKMPMRNGSIEHGLGSFKDAVEGNGPYEEHKLLDRWQVTEFDVEPPYCGTASGDNGQIIKFSRMPLRELFISTSAIKRAFENNGDNVELCLEQLFDEIRVDSGGRINLGVFENKANTQLQIVDINYTDVSNDLAKIKSTWFNQLFEFDISSGNSMVRDAELTFDLPSDKIGTVHAIKGAAASVGENKIFPISDILDDVISLEGIEKIMDSQGNPKKLVQYRPNPGKFRTDELNNADALNESLLSSYERVDTLFTTRFDNNPSVESAYASYGLIQGTTNDEGEVTESGYEQEFDAFETEFPDNKRQIDDSQKKEKAREKSLVTEIEDAAAEGKKVAATVADFYKYAINGDFFRNKRPSLLPMGCNLTMYGMGAINVGDCFRVNYLPRKFRNFIYFQVMKVTHNIGTDGWFTTLETQFRIRSDMKQLITKSNYFEMSNIILTSTALEDALPNNAGIPMEHIAFNYMKDIRPYPIPRTTENPLSNLAIAFEFTAKKPSRMGAAENPLIMVPFDIFPIKNPDKVEYGDFNVTSPNAGSPGYQPNYKAYEDYKIYMNSTIPTFLKQPPIEMGGTDELAAQIGKEFHTLGYLMTNTQAAVGTNTVNAEDIFGVELEVDDENPKIYYMIINKSQNRKYWTIIPQSEINNLHKYDRNFDLFKTTMKLKKGQVLTSTEKEVIISKVSTENSTPNPAPPPPAEPSFSEKMTQKVLKQCSSCKDRFSPLQIAKVLENEDRTGGRMIYKNAADINNKGYPGEGKYESKWIGWLGYNQWIYMFGTYNGVDGSWPPEGQSWYTIPENAGLNWLEYAEDSSHITVNGYKTSYFRARRYAIKKAYDHIRSMSSFTLTDEQGRSQQVSACRIQEGHAGGVYNTYYGQTGNDSYPGEYDDDAPSKGKRWSLTDDTYMNKWNINRFAGAPNAQLCYHWLTHDEKGDMDKSDVHQWPNMPGDHQKPDGYDPAEEHPTAGLTRANCGYFAFAYHDGSTGTWDYGSNYHPVFTCVGENSKGFKNQGAIQPWQINPEKNYMLQDSPDYNGKQPKDV